MKNFGLAFLIFLVWSTFGLWLYSWITPNQGIAVNVKNDSAVAEVKPNTISPLINDTLLEEKDTITSNEDLISTPKGIVARTKNSDIIFSYDEGFTFKKDSVGVIIPASTIDYKYKLVNYLKEHPELELHILSTYSPLEKLENPNLGVQRGAIIKEDLKAVGATNYQLVIAPIIDDVDFDIKGHYLNGIAFQFKTLDTNRVEEIASIVAEVPENITFYPRFSDTGILQSESLDALLISVKQVMENHPSVRLNIIGHTDNSANANLNFKMGLKYAEELLWFFKAKGAINPNRMTAVSKGEVRPIRSNKTASGRKANKRIEIQFIK